jgi:hypothetical protein
MKMRILSLLSIILLLVSCRGDISDSKVKKLFDWEKKMEKSRVEIKN